MVGGVDVARFLGNHANTNAVSSDNHTLLAWSDLQLSAPTFTLLHYTRCGWAITGAVTLNGHIVRDMTYDSLNLAWRIMTIFESATPMSDQHQLSKADSTDHDVVMLMLCWIDSCVELIAHIGASVRQWVYMTAIITNSEFWSRTYLGSSLAAKTISCSLPTWALS